MCDLIDHLEEGETIVLKSDYVLAVWNGSLIINFYEFAGHSWSNFDCCTMENLDVHSNRYDWYDARAHAREYLDVLVVTKCLKKC